MKHYNVIPGQEHLSSAERLTPGRLYISDCGDAIAPDGYCPELTSVIVDVVFVRFDAKDQMKALRALRLLTSYTHVAGEPWDAFLQEDDDAGARRVKGVLKLLGATTKQVPLDATIKVTHESETYFNVLLVTFRQFYRELCRRRLHLPDSPMDVKGWRSWPVKDRIAWAKERGYHPVWGIEHAGHRFFINQTEASSRMLYDPYDAVRRLSVAVDEIGAPCIIREIKEIQRVTGLRFSDFRTGTAFGYALAGLGDHFRCQNKQSRGALDKTAAMTVEVQEAVRGRFEEAAHPSDPSRTLWDRVVELAPLLAGSGPEKRRAETELKSYSLFGDDPQLPPPTYDAYRYWLRKAADRAGIVVQTNQGPWVPTSIVFRKAKISLAVKELFERTTDKAERKAGLEEICDRFHHSTDQTKAYAAWEYKLDAIRAARRQAEGNEAANAEARSTSPAPVRSPRLSTSTRAWLEKLGTRPSEVQV